MNKVYSAWLSELKFEHLGYSLFLRFLGAERLGKISAKTAGKPEAPVPARGHVSIPLLKATQEAVLCHTRPGRWTSVLLFSVLPESSAWQQF